MKRRSRSKSRNSKGKGVEDNAITNHESANDHNGSIVVDIINPSPDINTSVEFSKKRNASACTSSDVNSSEIGPPLKKRHLNDISKSQTKAQKRPNDTANDDLIRVNPQKLQKYTEKYRAWSKISDSQSLNSNSDSIEANRNFVVVSYNISPVSKLCVGNSRDFDIHHTRLMDELEYINADILCLQYVSNDYWSVLEKSLKEYGYHGHIIVGDNSRVGIATFYRSKRFHLLSIDSDKLSKLCFKNIPHNNSLDDTTMKTIKEYLDEPEQYMVALLQDRKQERLLIVGNTRLSDNKSDKPDLKCVQAVGLFWRIHDMICQIKTDHMNNNSCHIAHMSNPCWILCGDFNGAIDSPVYQICRDGYPNESSIEQLQAMKTLIVGANSQSLVDLIWHSFQHPFTDSGNSHLQWSTKASNDYIWMSETALKTEKVLLPVISCGHSTVAGASDMGGDHLSVACDLAFVS